MPNFDTPEPIVATLDFDVASVRITASGRTDTVVEVRPANDADEADVRAARQTSVTCSGGRLLVKGPRKRSLFSRSGAVEVRVALPAGSDVRGNAPAGNFLCEGPLGECRIKTSAGHLQVATATAVDLRTDYGDVSVDRVTGDATVVATGRIVVGEITGGATIKNGNGETTVGEVTGDLRVSAANGRISVGVAHAAVDAKSANGGIRIGEVVRGRTALHTAAGDLEVGVRPSTAVWLEAHTQFGRLHNGLGPAEGPAAGEETVEVRARTSMGDIVIRRA
ncbi:DUF4097 family beta strand repeat-containing protein [Streptomyces sp. NPDC052496]|uniref:DUF4097 family beta strand repeat-containing protein n=1 Tax=Streptomyces sp. NPDC052496 TaxID=3154951 RepID=UPI00342380BD